MRLDLDYRKNYFYNKGGDGTLETDRLPKQHSVMIKGVYPLTEIVRLSGYYEGLNLSVNWIKDRMSITRGMTTKY